MGKDYKNQCSCITLLGENMKSPEAQSHSIFTDGAQWNNANNPALTPIFLSLTPGTPGSGSQPSRNNQVL